MQFVAVELDGQPKRESDIGHVRVIPLSQAVAVTHEMGRGADGSVKYDWNSSSVLVGSPLARCQVIGRAFGAKSVNGSRGTGR